MTNLCFSQIILLFACANEVLLNLFNDHVRVSMIFHINYSRIKTIRNSSIDITISEYPNLEEEYKIIRC
jgi:hypothetical protein